MHNGLPRTMVPIRADLDSIKTLRDVPPPEGIVCQTSQGGILSSWRPTAATKTAQEGRSKSRGQALAAFDGNSPAEKVKRGLPDPATPQVKHRRPGQ